MLCIFSLRSLRVGRCWRTFALTPPNRLSNGSFSTCCFAEEDWHHLPNYYCCCVYNFRGSHPLQSELIPRYWAAAPWKTLSLKSHTMWERDVQRASAGRRILTVCAHVWVGGDRRGDISAANVAQVERRRHMGHTCVKLKSHLQQTNEDDDYNSGKVRLTKVCNLHTVQKCSPRMHFFFFFLLSWGSNLCEWRLLSVALTCDWNAAISGWKLRQASKTGVCVCV